MNPGREASDTISLQESGLTLLSTFWMTLAKSFLLPGLVFLANLKAWALQAPGGADSCSSWKACPPVLREGSGMGGGAGSKFRCSRTDKSYDGFGVSQVANDSTGAGAVAMSSCYL